MKKPKKKRLSGYLYIRLSDDIKKRIQAQADKEGMNMTIWTRSLIIKTLESLD